MSVNTFNPSDLSQSAANWGVAQRIVGRFAPHAQAAPDTTLVLDQGHLLNGATLIEVGPQTVGPFTTTASFRVDRVVVDKGSGVAAIIVGTDGSTTPPGIPAGTLPVARVYLRNDAEAVTNAVITDERALQDVSPPSNAIVLCRAKLSADQTGVLNSVNTKIAFDATDFNIGDGFDTSNHWFKPTVAGYYQLHAQIGINALSGHNFGIYIHKNGSIYNGCYLSPGQSVAQTVAVSDLVYLNGSTDTIELYGAQTNGTSGAFKSSGSFFTAQYVAA